MTPNKNNLPLLILVASGILLSVFFGIKFFKKTEPARQLYRTDQIKKRSFAKEIDAPGILKSKDTLRIGSLVNGIVREIFVEENQPIEAGSALAVIETSSGDTSLIIAQERVKGAQYNVLYKKNRYNRIKNLFKNQQIAPDAFEQERAIYKAAKSELAIQRAIFQQEERNLHNTTVKAPQAGTIIATKVSLGEPVIANTQGTVLFEMAPDVKKMRVNIEIDESDVTSVKQGQRIRIILDALPDKIFEENIISIGYSAKNKGSQPYYEGVVEINNNDGILRPGMLCNGTITIGEALQAPSLQNIAFDHNKNAIQGIAKQLEFNYIPLPDSSQAKKTVWILQEKSFVEKEIVTGFANDTYTHIISGIEESDLVLIDVDEENALAEFYKKAFRTF